MGSSWKSPTFVILAFALSLATGFVGVWGLLPGEHSPRISQLSFGLVALAVVLSVLALGPALDLLPVVSESIGRGAETWKTPTLVRVRSPRGPTFISPPWTQSGADVCTSLSCSVVGGEHAGLSDEEASRRVLEYGQNVVQSVPPPNPLLFFLKELHEPTQLLLLAVGVLYSLVGSRPEAVAAFVVIALMAAAEMGTEFRAKVALGQLRTSTPRHAMLLRSGLSKQVDRKLVAPGDLVLLRGGMEVPADIRLLEAVMLQVDESSITGEAAPVAKDARLLLPAETPVMDRENVVLAGTLVTGGRGKGVVYATGRATVLGGNVELAGKQKEKKTPLQKMLKEAAGKLTLVAVVASLGGTALGLWKGARWQDAILTGLSLAFATIPEELPILVTAVLAVGGQILSKKKIFAKRLQGAESLGYVDTLLTDKTGTLTQNQLELQGWAADPPLLLALRGRSNEGDGDDKAASELMEAWVFMAEVWDLADPPETRELGLGGEVADPFDRAVLLSWGRKGGEAVRALRAAKRAARVVEDVPFHSATKTSSRTFCREGKTVQYLKGAPELLVGVCAGGEAMRWREAIEAAAATGLRMIGYAVRRGEASEPAFVGVVAFRDPVRVGAAEAVASCRAAGIRVVMVTGDHLSTAQAVALQVGLLHEAEGSHLCTGGAVGDVEAVLVFARATPTDKYAILQALQEGGHCVAVTGDGANDAPVLAHADVGLAMGGGSDAAREAAPIVMLDDSFGSVVDALTEGRRLVDNLRKAIAFYLGAKAGLLILFAVGTLWDRFPLAPIHIIVLELFMDLGASTSFVVEPADRNVMLRKPRSRVQPFFDTELLLGVAATSVSLSTSVLVCFGYAVWHDASTAQTCSFYAWLLTHVFVAMNMRSLAEPVLPKGILSNVVMVVWLAFAVLLACVLAVWGDLRGLLHITSVSWEAWTTIVGVSIISSWWVEGIKWCVELVKVDRARALAVSEALGVDNLDVEKGDLRQPLMEV